jgi:hypothetical protein
MNDNLGWPMKQERRNLNRRLACAALWALAWVLVVVGAWGMGVGK